MPWRGIVESSNRGQGLTVPQHKTFVEALDFRLWRPSLIVVHNTGAPTLVQWKGYPAAKRIQNLVRYYRDEQKWQAGPHAFIADDLIWPFTPYNVKGTHSPSWNGIGLGLEMVGDFDSEEFNSGDGLKVRNNTIAVIAHLCEKLGLDPRTALRLHRMDPKTTHKCPGSKVSLEAVIDAVEEYMGHGGDHVEIKDSERESSTEKEAPAKLFVVSQKVGEEGLNLRENSSASSFIKQALPKGTVVGEVRREKNGLTLWSFVKGKDFEGWVASRYLEPAPAQEKKDGGQQAGR